MDLPFLSLKATQTITITIEGVDIEIPKTKELTQAITTLVAMRKDGTEFKKLQAELHVLKNILTAWKLSPTELNNNPGGTNEQPIVDQESR